MNTAITEGEGPQHAGESGVHGMTNLAEGAEVTATFTPDAPAPRPWAEKAPC